MGTEQRIQGERAGPFGQFEVHDDEFRVSVSSQGQAGECRVTCGFELLEGEEHRAGQPCQNHRVDSQVSTWPESRPLQGPRTIMLFELVLCITLPRVGPGKLHH